MPRPDDQRQQDPKRRLDGRRLQSVHPVCRVHVCAAVGKHTGLGEKHRTGQREPNNAPMKILSHPGQSATRANGGIDASCAAAERSYRLVTFSRACSRSGIRS
jgi:hypothetical protein